MPDVTAPSKTPDLAIQRWLAESTSIETYWNFKKLCQDLAKYKKNQRPLSGREIEWLQGLLLGYTPQQIGRLVNNAENADAIRPSLSRQLYPLIVGLIQVKAGETVRPSSARMLVCLERIGYRKDLYSPPTPQTDINLRLNTICN
jgi:hypothetical protein